MELAPEAAPEEVAEAEAGFPNDLLGTPGRSNTSWGRRVMSRYTCPIKYNIEDVSVRNVRKKHLDGNGKDEDWKRKSSNG